MKQPNYRMILLCLVVGLAFALYRESAEAQTKEPTWYLVSKLNEGGVYWFETGDTECYVIMMRTYHGAGSGISCLRKVQP